MLFRYPCEIVWAAAAGAQRINDGYRKHGAWDIEDSNNTYNEKSSNKKLVFSFLEQYRENKKIDLIEEDYENGKNVRQFWQNKTLALLDDNTNEYIRSVILTSSKEIIDGMYDVSLIASCIQAKSRDEQQQILNDTKLNLNSKAVLEVNDKHLWGTDSNICVIKSVYIDRVSSSIVECVVDGNLYSWWSGLKIELGKYTSLRGKVKQITTDKDTGQIVTRLNYVKIAK